MQSKNTIAKIVALSTFFLFSNALFSAGFSWAIDTTGKCLFRNSADATGSWIVDTVTTLPLTYIATGHTGEVWALTAESVPPAAPVANIWYRNGVTASNLQGTGWTNVSGILANLCVGYNGELVGVNSGGGAYFRNGFAAPWLPLGAGIKQLAIGPNGIIWAIKPDLSIWIRTGITADLPQGVDWQLVDGLLSAISIGQGGVLYGITTAGAALKRTNITPSNPAGSGWSLLSTTPAMTTISAGHTGQVSAVDTAGKGYFWSGSAWQEIAN